MEEVTEQVAIPTEAEIRHTKRDELIALAINNEIQITQSEGVKGLRNLITKYLYADEDEEEQKVQEVSDCNYAGNNHSSAGEVNLEFEKFKLELTAMERREEAEAQERKEREEAETQERKEREIPEYEFRVRQLEPQGPREVNNSTRENFIIDACYKSLPQFDENDVENYFKLFERLADGLDWPKEHWYIIAQAGFRGKSVQAFSALNETQARNYDQVKQAVLRAYEATSEAYR